jgi:exopolysaccharide biosynthesis polyprenyl glycosylphosphotransferase
VKPPNFIGWPLRAKRTFDIMFSALALIVLSPVLLVIAIAIYRDDPGPIIFRQQRIGLNGKPFTIHKFRSMSIDAESKLALLRSQSMTDGPLFKMDDDPRITRVGRVLRKYSLDELPQFWTVLRGNMSVVGPRPHLEKELDDFPDEGLRRLLIKPGITGLWQVSGRSDLSLEDSVKLDLRYVQNWSLLGDVVIIMKTVRAIVTPQGAY